MFLSLKKVVTSVLFASLLAINVSFGSYQISVGGQVYNSTVGPSSNEGKYKVEFYVDNSLEKTMYVDEGYELSLKDAPSDYLINGSTSYYKYTAENGSVLNDHIIVSEETFGSDKELVITGSATNFENQVIVRTNTKTSSNISQEQQISSNYNEDLVPGNEYIGKPDNEIFLTSSGYNQNVNLNYAGWVNGSGGGTKTGVGKRSDATIKDGEYQNVTHQNQNEDGNYVTASVNCKINSNGNFFGFSNLEGTTDLGIFKVYQDKARSYNGDTTIGLEYTVDDSDTVSNEADEYNYIKRNASYKTTQNMQNKEGNDLIWDGTANSTSTHGVTNYCANRVILTKDVVWTGTLSIGGLTGFYGTGQDYSQYCFGGFIIGTYCELDLNGYDFICLDTNVDHNDGTHGMVDSWGSITDTSEDRSGNLIMGAGTYLYSPFVFEDEDRIEGLPLPYVNGAPSFTCFRCPYLDCNIIFRQESKFYGKIKIDLEGGSNGNGVYADLYILGNSFDQNTPLFENRSTNQESYIKRSVTYMETNDDFAKTNILNQQIHYDVWNSFININNFSFDMDVGISFTYNSAKTPFVVPPYYSFNLYSTQFTTDTLLVFLPNSYLNVDPKSEIVLKNGTYGTFSGASMLSSQNYQNAGGLYFADVLPTGSTSIIKGDSAGWYRIASSTGIQKQQNEKPAYCNLDGKITFEYDSDNPTQYHPFMLGGHINISDMNSFEHSINSFKNTLSQAGQQDYSNYLQLYGNYFTSKQAISSGVTGNNRINQHNFAVNAYINTPLISFGKVITDPNDCTSLRAGEYYFDSHARVIYSGNNLSDGSNVYALICDDYSNTVDNMYKAFDLDEADSLTASYQEVTFKNDHGQYISLNNTSYINFRGCFVPVEELAGTGSSATCTITTGLNKFAGSAAYNMPSSKTLRFNAQYTTASSVYSWNC